MYECFHCCCRSVIWDSDFSFEDCGYEGDGLVQFCHCTNCGAEIEYRIPYPEQCPSVADNSEDLRASEGEDNRAGEQRKDEP